MLKTVHRDTVSSTRRFDLRDLLLFFKLHQEERDDALFDWGHGDSFGVEFRYEDFENWTPVDGSEVCDHLSVELLAAENLIEAKWTVMDPKEPLSFKFVIDKASRAVAPGLSFKFPLDGQDMNAKSSQPLRSDCFSFIPTELRLRVLEMLPTASVLNLFLASSAFRELRGNLPQSFWKFRLFFDVPWCAHMVLAQTTSQRSGQILFNQLLHQLKEASKSGIWTMAENNGGDKSTLTKDSLGLKNRRHVWLNCERILKDIEARQATVRQQAGSIWTGLRSLTSRKVISVSRPSEHRPDVTSDAYLVPDLDKKGQPREITAHLARDGHIVGVEFKLSHESSGRLFGNRSDIVDRTVFDSDMPIVALMISFGSLQRHQDKSAMFSLGIVVEDCPSEPVYTIGAWNGQDVIQILRAESGMEVIGITGEFNVRPLKSSSPLWHHHHTNHLI